MSMNSKVFIAYKERLEDVLDEGFPKIHEEGPKKKANKRGPALALFAEATSIILEIMRAFGGCTKCYGKGYGTQTLNYKESADFIGDKTTYTKAPTMVFCTCDRGRDLQKFIHEIHRR